MKHLEHLAHVAASDVAFINWKDRAYGGSWKRSGGRSAWFMCVRMMDRLRVLLRQPEPPEDWIRQSALETAKRIANDYAKSGTSEVMDYLLRSLTAQDVFAAIQAEPSGKDGTVLAVIRDLRRYLILIEAEMVARGVVQTEKVPT